MAKTNAKMLRFCRNVNEPSEIVQWGHTGQERAQERSGYEWKVKEDNRGKEVENNTKETIKLSRSRMNEVNWTELLVAVAPGVVVVVHNQCDQIWQNLSNLAKIYKSLAIFQ